ncbi:hypothetical protein JQ506_12960 [Shinella sp. PSBB067]|uniref:hypothetical protein n=1 Tax=Shinella sp. PSBB067 TaxID=2715959 RepID=UPI00193BC432|nr:hypothetical protein [Shinella sp. PSBB067]QRI61818.1 hypothetical protein JQ506_12960 [Shinella sp. PSBB067]
MAKEAFDPDTVITLAHAGDMLGISRKRVSQLVQDGFIQRSGRGTTTILAAVRGYTRYWQERAAEKTKSSADARVRDARAAEIEQRIAERGRKAVRADEATAAIDYVVAACKRALAALPAMITDTPAERVRIEKVVRAAERGIARRKEEAEKLLKDGGKLPDAE